jgi:hypothetical protein
VQTCVLELGIIGTVPRLKLFPLTGGKRFAELKREQWVVVNPLLGAMVLRKNEISKTHMLKQEKPSIMG